MFACTFSVTGEQEKKKWTEGEIVCSILSLTQQILTVVF